MAPRQRTEASPLDALLSRGEIAQVALDPELFSDMLEDLADVVGAPRRKRPGVIEAALLSYGSFHALDPDAPLAPTAMREMAALASRLSALMDLGDSIPPSEDPERYLALAEAACSARLIEKDGKPAFQVLDFLAALGRAERRKG